MRHDLYDIGTVATVLQLLHLPDGTVKVLVEGVQRARMIEFKHEAGYLAANLELIIGCRRIGRYRNCGVDAQCFKSI